MAGADYGGVLLRVADALCVELGYDEGAAMPSGLSTFGEDGLTARILSPEDEALAASLRRALEKIAGALGFGLEEAREQAVQSALDLAELVTRGELMRCNAERLPRMMPSLVFLVALPIVDQDRALEISQRTTELIARETGGS